MPKVKFRVNLGTRDAQPLGLDAKKCQAGSELDVDAKTAEELQKLGVIEPLELHAVPREATAFEPQEPAHGTVEKATKDLEDFKARTASPPTQPAPPEAEPAKPSEFQKSPHQPPAKPKDEPRKSTK